MCNLMLLISWLNWLPHVSEWDAGQNPAAPTLNSSALQTLKQLHDTLLTHYNCTDCAPPQVTDAHASYSPAQEHDSYMLSLFPFLD